jgi:hypothetical protein
MKLSGNKQNIEFVNRLTKAAKDIAEDCRALLCFVFRLLGSIDNL